jgi:hypothetical protein
MPEGLIETAIGLFFVYILMSMVASQIVEWIAGLRSWRAKDLERTIRAMLYDPTAQKKLDQDALVLADKLYEHPLIASLARPGSRPSYIPAGKFSLALFDVIVTAGTETSTIGRARVGLEQVKNHLLSALHSPAEAELADLISQVQKLIDNAKAGGPNPEAIAALSLPPLLNDQINGFYKRYSISPSTLNALVQPLMADSDLQLNQVLNGVVQLSKMRPQLAQLITSLSSGLDVSLATGESRLAATRRNIEEWFDDTMDRAGGWYKRHTQIWLAIVGFGLALLLNVDSMNVAMALWRDPTLRQNVVEQAQKYPFVAVNGSLANVDDAAKAIRNLNSQLSQDLMLPVGWRTLSSNQESCALFSVDQNPLLSFPYKKGCILIMDSLPGPIPMPLAKLLGLLITAAAISQGAPFWFDLLSKVGNLRSSGAVPATSAEKAAQKAIENGSQKGSGETMRALP